MGKADSIEKYIYGITKHVLAVDTQTEAIETGLKLGKFIDLIWSTPIN